MRRFSFNSMQPELYFFGLAGEFILGAVANELRKRGWNCYVFDFIDSQTLPRLNAQLQSSRAPKIVLSSQHPAYSIAHYAPLIENAAYVPTLSDVCRMVNPLRTLLFAHDLSDPIHSDEIQSLREVTAFFVPTDGYWWLSRYTKVINAGWPKLISGSAPPLSDRKIAVLPTDVGTYALKGQETFGLVFSGLSGSLFVFKLPFFSKTDHLSEELETLGGRLVDPKSSSIDLIQASEVVVSNGLSSIVTESALLGKDTICLIDGIHSDVEQRRRFMRYPNVTLVKPEGLKAAISARKGARVWPVVLKAFDVNLLESILHGHSAQ